MKKFYALFMARNLEFLRDRATLAWNVVFPLAIIFAFAFMFDDASKDLYKVGVLELNAEQIRQSEEPFFQTRYLDFIPMPDATRALEKVSRHQLEMVVDLTREKAYWINNSNPKGYILEKILRGADASLHLEKRELTGREIRYVDWLFPGVLGMNVMFSCLFGVGWVIVRYRKIKILRRLKASPINAFQFLSAQVVSRLIVVMVMTTALFVGSDLLLDLYVTGSLGALFIVFLAGSFCMISLSLVVSCRTHSEELASGLLNLLTWPMMLLSGVWFSLEGTNPLVQKLALFFPLTHMLDAARKISIDGLTLVEVAPEVLLLIGMSLVFLVISSLLFRWE